MAKTSDSGALSRPCEIPRRAPQTPARELRLFVMTNTAAQSISSNLTMPELKAEIQEMKMTTNTNQASASDALTRMADYVGYLFEDVSNEQAIESHHFECSEPASRGLNRHYELGELMSLTYPH